MTPPASSTAPIDPDLAAAIARDTADPLAPLRDRFLVPDDVIYLDGNSLGVLPKGVAERVSQAVSGEWGQGLIRSWNTAGWVDLPGRIGARIAGMIGARPDCVIAADSTTVNLFKVLSAAVALTPTAHHTARFAPAVP